MAKMIQIPEQLFKALLRYHLLNDDVDNEYIKQELQRKIDRLALRESYSRSKSSALSDSERCEALREYLEMRKRIDEMNV